MPLFSSDATLRKSFLAAIERDDVAQARAIWEQGARRFPSLLATAWSAFPAAAHAPASALEHWLSRESVSADVPRKWRSAAACQALFRCPLGDAVGWDRRWKWTRSQVRWKTDDPKVLLDATALASVGKDATVSAIAQWRLAKMLQHRPRVPGNAWMTLAGEDQTLEIARGLPAAATTAPEFRGALLALAALTPRLTAVREAWRTGFVAQGLPFQVEPLHDVDEDGRFPGTQRFADRLGVTPADLHILGYFRHSDVYEEAFPDDGPLRVDLAWAKGASTDPGQWEHLAAAFRKECMGQALPPAEPRRPAPRARM